MLSCNRCWRRLYLSLSSPVTLRPTPLTSLTNSTSKLSSGLAATNVRNYARAASLPSSTESRPRREREPEMDLPENLEDISNPVKLQSVVKLYIAKGQTHRALDLVLSAAGKIDTVGSYNAILADMMVNKRSHDAWRTYNDMKKRQVWPNQYTITTMISGFASNLEQGDQVWKRALQVYKSLDAENSKVPRSIIHTNAILKVLAKAGQHSEMWEIVGELPDSGENSPDAITYTIMFNALRMTKGDHSSSIPDAKRMWDGIMMRWDKGEMDVDDHMVASMGRVLLTSNKETDYELILDIVEYAFGIKRPVPRKFKQTEEHYVPKNIHKPLRVTRNVFSLVIEACGKLRLLDAAPLYWNQFEKKHRIRPDIENYHSLLRYYRAIKDGPAAESLLRKIASPNNNLEIDQKSFYIAMAACRRSGRSQSYEAAVKILDLHRNNTPTGATKGDPKLLAMFLEVALKIGDQSTIKRAIKQFRDHEFPAPEENKLFRDFPVRTAAVRAAQNKEKRDARTAAKRILLWKLGKTVLETVNSILDERVKNVTTSPEERRMLTGFRNETIEWMERRLGGEDEINKDIAIVGTEEAERKLPHEIEQLDAWNNAPAAEIVSEEPAPAARSSRRNRDQEEEDQNPEVPDWYKRMSQAREGKGTRSERRSFVPRSSDQERDFSGLESASTSEIRSDINADVEEAARSRSYAGSGGFSREDSERRDGFQSRMSFRDMNRASGVRGEERKRVIRREGPPREEGDGEKRFQRRESGERDGERGGFSRGGFSRGGFSRGGERDGESRGGFSRGGERDGESRGFSRGGDRGGFSRGGGRGGFSRGGDRGGFSRGGDRGGFSRGGERDGESRGFSRGGEKDGESRGFSRGGERDGESRGFSRVGEKDGESRGFSRGGERDGESRGFSRGGERDGESRGFSRGADRGGFSRGGDRDGGSRGGFSRGGDRDGGSRTFSRGDGESRGGFSRGGDRDGGSRTFSRGDGESRGEFSPGGDRDSGSRTFSRGGGASRGGFSRGGDRGGFARGGDRPARRPDGQSTPRWGGRGRQNAE